ncbi:MAG: STAS/SEC14 domain-containing protein [Rhodoferax sp.]
MTIEVAFESPDLLVLRAHGVLLREEVDAAKRQVHAFMQQHGRMHLLMVIDDGFADLEAFASWEDIEEDAFIQQHVIRLAIVGDLRWRDKAVLFFLNAVGRFQIHYFKPEHDFLAREWLLAH